MLFHTRFSFGLRVYSLVLTFRPNDTPPLTRLVMRVDGLVVAALSALAAGQPMSTPLPTTTAEAAVMWEADVLWAIQQFGGSLVSYCWRR